MEYSGDELQVCEFDICNLGYGAPLIMGTPHGLAIVDRGYSYDLTHKG